MTASIALLQVQATMTDSSDSESCDLTMPQAELEARWQEYQEEQEQLHEAAWAEEQEQDTICQEQWLLYLHEIYEAEQREWEEQEEALRSLDTESQTAVVLSEE